MMHLRALHTFSNEPSKKCPGTTQTSGKLEVASQWLENALSEVLGHI